MTERPRSAFRSHLVPELLRYATARGADVDALARRHGVEIDARERSEVRIDLEIQAALFDDAARLLDDAALGVHLAQSLSRRPLDLLQYACLNAPTVGDALRRVARYMPLYNEFVDITLNAADRGGQCLQHGVLGHREALGRHANELWMCLVLVRARAACRDEVVPRRAWFAHAAADSGGELQRLLGTDAITFGATTNGIELDAATLARPIPDSDGHLLALLDRIGDDSLAQLPSERGLPGAVARSIARRLPDGAPRLPDTARSLALGPRTLQRRLTEAGTSHAAIVDAVRSRLARQAVEEGLTVDAMAAALGFSERGAFLRAFARWTGVKPSQLRTASRSG